MHCTHILFGADFNSKGSNLFHPQSELFFTTTKLLCPANLLPHLSFKSHLLVKALITPPSPFPPLQSLSGLGVV